MSLKILKPSKNHFISKVSSESKHPKTHMLHGMGLEYICLQYFYHKFEPLKCRLKSSSPNLTKAHLFFFSGPQTLGPMMVADRRNRQELTIPNVKDRIDALQYRLSKAVLLRKTKHHDIRFERSRGKKWGWGGLFYWGSVFFRGSNPWNSYAHPGSPVSPFFSPVGFPSFTIFFRYGVYHLPKGTTIF